MRALITLAFVVFLVISALYFAVSGFISYFAWPLAIGFFLIWCLVAFPFVGALCIVWIKDEKPRFSPSDLYSFKRNYQSWNSIRGWPRGENLFYECDICHKSLPSQSESVTTCGCGNVFIGPDHIGAQTPAKVRLFEEA